MLTRLNLISACGYTTFQSLPGYNLYGNWSRFDVRREDEGSGRVNWRREDVQLVHTTDKVIRQQSFHVVVNYDRHAHEMMSEMHENDVKHARTMVVRIKRSSQDIWVVADFWHYSISTNNTTTDLRMCLLYQTC